MLEDTKFQKRIIYILYISLFFNFVFIGNPSMDKSSKDTFIRYNYPVLMDFLVKEIISLEEIIVKSSSDSDESIESIKEKVIDTGFSIYNINDTLYETRRLNPNFNKNVSELTEFLLDLRDDILDSKGISDEQIQTLEKVVSIAKQYGGRPSRVSTYSYGANVFQRMQMPLETKRFFEKIELVFTTE